MDRAESYERDVLFYFGERQRERALYERLFARMSAALPDAAVKVQKSQISFYHRRLFGAASVPVRRKKDWPKECLLVTFGLGYRVEHPRIAVATEPYPNRWTHHVVVSREEEMDGVLLDWLAEAYDFAWNKG